MKYASARESAFRRERNAASAGAPPLSHASLASRAGIQRYAVDLDAATRRRGALEPPQNRPDSRHQLAGVERLRQIIVRAQLEADNAVRVLAARGQHEDRHSAAPAQLPEDLETVHARKHHV